MRWDFGSVARARQHETVIVLHGAWVPGRGRLAVWAGDGDRSRSGPARRSTPKPSDGARIAEDPLARYGVITTGAASLAHDGEPQVWATRWSLARHNQPCRPLHGRWHADFVPSRTRNSPAGLHADRWMQWLLRLD